MTILETINEKFPIRRSDKQKEAFRKWVMAEMNAMGYRAHVEENDKGKHRNVIAGDPESAELTVTAHYDTPACIGIPNLMIPRNWAVYYLYQILVIGGMIVIALAAGLAIGAVLQDQRGMLIGYFGVYMALLLLMLYGPANKHNVNDNTSGVAAVLETMARIPVEQRPKIAFILFDNEEKGCRGSKAYAREHLQMQHIKLVVNLDCVGVGEHFIVSSPRLARNMEQYELLEQVLSECKDRTAHFYSSFTTRGNSDYRSFKCGVGISAYRMVSGVGFYTGAIHTARDTQADQGNIEYLAQALSETIARLTSGAQEALGDGQTDA
ncbi:MAG: M28 family peptidase [Clostridia bacterium]|nr:M28 family peptidase [Clostridia bacterium]